MDTNVFISGIEINEIKKTNQNGYRQMSISFFDKDGKESSFLTSIMTEESMQKYEQSLLEILQSKNWTQAIYGPNLTNLTTIKDSDDEKHLIGFETTRGMILKNEVKLYSNTLNPKNV